jgi:hypothetical protein
MEKKIFYELQRHTARSKIDNNLTREIHNIQEAKFLWHWRQLYVQEKQKQDAVEFVQSAFLHQVITAWRAQTDKQIRSKGFFKNVTQRNQVSFVY